MVLIFLTCGVLLAYGIFVTLLAIQWNKLYFEKGIPVYNKSIPFNKYKRTSNIINTFINNIDSYEGLFRYTGKTIDENTFYFRKKMVNVGRKDTGNIHGAIIIDTENRVIKIKGRESFSIILLLAVPFSFTVAPEFSMSKVFETFAVIIIIILISFAFSHHRYKQLFKIITQLIGENEE